MLRLLRHTIVSSALVLSCASAPALAQDDWDDDWVQEGELLRQVGVLIILKLRKELLGMKIGSPDDLPEFSDYLLQIVEGALVFGYDLLPIPLVHVTAVVVIKEIILADSTHVGQNTLPNLHPELLQGPTFPLGGGLHHLSVDGVLVVIIGDMELDGGSRAVAIEEMQEK